MVHPATRCQVQFRIENSNICLRRVWLIFLLPGPFQSDFFISSFFLFSPLLRIKPSNFVIFSNELATLGDIVIGSFFNVNSWLSDSLRVRGMILCCRELVVYFSSSFLLFFCSFCRLKKGGASHVIVSCLFDNFNCVAMSISFQCHPEF